MAQRIGVQNPARNPAVLLSVTDLPNAAVIDQIAATSLIHSGSTAVASEQGEISYRALMAAVNDLAAEMAALGVGPDVPVGICIPRSPDLVVAILAALRAGGAFLPIDPLWPQERIRYVLRDAGAPVAVAPAARAASLRIPGLRVLPSDVKHQRHGSGCVGIEAMPHNLAYIIYTSGSTGEPKGVEITRANLSNLIDWHIAAFGVNSQDRMSCLAGLSFDALVWELLPVLAAGGSVHLVPEGVRTSGPALRQWLVEQKITIAYVPTALAELLIDSDWPCETALRTMLTGGDVLHVWPRQGLPFTLVNNYGPSECAVVATSGVVAARPATSTAPTIGRPIANCEVEILRDDGAPVDLGETGEIHISGANVGRGYRGRPAMTAERFTTTAACRRYRTGDLGSWTFDGQIVFHGRRDEQLKIRGYRIEPDEISAALDRHAAVSQSVVTVLDERGTRRLVAYLVPAPDKTASASELREFLAAFLPTYMLPDLFVRIDALPVTPNGKVDRGALPAPSAATMLRDGLFREASSDVERQIARLIEDLLRLERVGADDNFFLLGGHSLLGTQLVLGLREKFGAELMLRDLFEAPTVAQLAHKVEEAVFKMVSSMAEEEVRRRLTR